MVELPGMLRDSSENTTSPEDFVASGNTPSPAPKDAQQKRPGKPIRNFQDLRTMSMTKKRENIGGNPTSGHKNPESQCPVLFTPRK
jgi:hypothetical protein